MERVALPANNNQMLISGATSQVRAAGNACYDPDVALSRVLSAKRRRGARNK